MALLFLRSSSLQCPIWRNEKYWNYIFVCAKKWRKAVRKYDVAPFFNPINYSVRKRAIFRRVEEGKWEEDFCMISNFRLSTFLPFQGCHRMSNCCIVSASSFKIPLIRYDNGNPVEVSRRYPFEGLARKIPRRAPQSLIRKGKVLSPPFFAPSSRKIEHTSNISDFSLLFGGNGKIGVFRHNFFFQGRRLLFHPVICQFRWNDFLASVCEWQWKP